MQNGLVLEAGTGWDRLAIDPRGAGHALNVVLIYEDAEARRWAKDLFDRAARFAGPESLHPSWWRMGDLSAPGVLAGAVSTALRADVVVVATHAAEGLPMAFYVWVDAWLPHRPQNAGALVALLGKRRNSAPSSGRVRDYLNAVAREGRLDFVIQEQAA